MRFDLLEAFLAGGIAGLLLAWAIVEWVFRTKRQEIAERVWEKLRKEIENG